MVATAGSAGALGDIILAGAATGFDGAVFGFAGVWANAGRHTNTAGKRNDEWRMSVAEIVAQQLVQAVRHN